MSILKNEEEIKNQLGFIEEAIKDYKKGELSIFATWITISIVFNDHSPPKKILKMFKKRIKEYRSKKSS